MKSTARSVPEWADRGIGGEGHGYAPILIVDDDPHIGLAIRAWLRRYGFRVSMADGGSNGRVKSSDKLRGKVVAG